MFPVKEMKDEGSANNLLSYEVNDIEIESNNPQANADPHEDGVPAAPRSGLSNSILGAKLLQNAFYAKENDRKMIDASKRFQ